MSLQVVLDGITMQQAGELMFNTEATRKYRKACRQTYRQSLEDFSFAILLGDQICASASMPKVGKVETPGQQLSTRIKEWGLLIPIEFSARDFLTRPDVLGAVELDLRRLDGLASPFFSEFFIRETHSYLGEDGSLRAVDPLPPGAYRFEFGDEHYVKWEELQGLLPKRFIEDMASVVTDTAPGRPVSATAVHEFVTRVMLTHIANDWAYEAAVESTAPQGVRLPYVTRAVIRGAREKDEGREDVKQRKRHRIKKGVVPHALMHIVTRLDADRSQFLNGLRDLREERDFRDLRRYLGDLIVELEQGHDEAADTLLRDIERYKRSTHASPDQISIAIPMLRLADEALGNLSPRVMKPGRYVLRRLIQLNPITDDASYYRKLSGIFPEMDP